MWNGPPPEPTSRLNVETTTTSVGDAMLTNCVCISARTNSNCSEYTLPHDFW